MKVPYLDLRSAHKPLISKFQSKLYKFLDNGRFVLGEEVKKFEKEYARFSETKYCVGVSSGLDALILSLMSLDVGNGDEVILASNSYIATVISVLRLGAKPIFVEPKLETFNINPNNIEKAITEKTKVIIPTHFFGQASEMDEIVKISKKHKLSIVEDNAQSHGSSFRGKTTGSFGEVNATSFYPSKNLGALGEAGAITTNNKKIYERLKVLRNYGTKKRYFNDELGFNARLDEIQAAFLRIKLNNLLKNNKKRQKIAKKYLDGLKGVNQLYLPKTAEGARHVYYIFAIRTEERDELQKFLLSKGVQTLVHYPVPPHLQKACSFLGYKEGDFPIAEELASTELSLPIYPELTEEQVGHVIDTIKQFFRK